MVQLFNYARAHGYLPKGMPTEAEAVKPLDVVPSENKILTAAEMTKLLNTEHDYLIPPLVIKAFSGVRTEEMVRMDWKNINFVTKHIILPAAVTKTRRRRLIPIQDNLLSWLEPHRKKSGRICERWQNPQTLTQAFDRHGKDKGIKVGANRFRNSYISYRVAVTHDVQRVALESGKSPGIIQQEYLELATEDEGKLWFAITPESVKAAAEEKARRKALMAQAQQQNSEQGKISEDTAQHPEERVQQFPVGPHVKVTRMKAQNVKYVRVGAGIALTATPERSPAVEATSKPDGAPIPSTAK